MSGCSRGCPMRRASRAEAAGSRVTPADVVCFNSATRAESSAGRRDIVDGTSFHAASSPCHSDLIHQTITDPSQENIASNRSMRDASERNEVYASRTAPLVCPQRLSATHRCQLRQSSEEWANGGTRDSSTTGLFAWWCFKVGARGFPGSPLGIRAGPRRLHH